MKKVSVIIPAYNKAELTIKTVESVLKQTYKDIEIIVVNDGSTDDTEKKLTQFGDSIVYIYKENGGACSARNLGIKKSSGSYIALIDCDDIFYPDKILKSVQYLENNTNVGCVQTAVNLIDDHDNVVGSIQLPEKKVAGWIAEQLFLTNLVNSQTLLIRKECFDKVGLFDESIFIPADWDMWLRLSEQYEFGYIDVPLSGYRVTENYTISHLQSYLKDQFHVSEKAIKRGKIPITERLKNKRHANVFYSVGKLYGARGEIHNSREFFKKAIRFDYSNVKAIFHYLLAKLFPVIHPGQKTERALPKYFGTHPHLMYHYSEKGSFP